MGWKFTLRIIFFSLLSMILLAANVEAGRVRVAIPSTTHAVLAFSTSRDKGYYRDEGLDVELILMSAPIASRALLSGDRGRRRVAAGAQRRAAAIYLYHL